MLSHINNSDRVIFFATHDKKGYNHMKNHISTCIIIFFIVATIGFAVWPMQWNEVRRTQAKQAKMLSHINGFIQVYQINNDKLPESLTDLREHKQFREMEQEFINDGLIKDLSEIKYTKTLETDQITLLYTKDGEWACYGDGHVKKIK